NSQFSETIKASGEVSWFPRWDTHLAYNADGYTWYTTGWHTTEDNVPDLPLPGAQVGQVIYRLDGTGPWRPLDGKAITSPDGQSHTIQVVVNDEAGQYGDNSGSFNLTVTRTKG